MTWFTGDGADYFDGGESPFDDDGLTVLAREHEDVEAEFKPLGGKLLAAVSGTASEVVTALNIEEVTFIGDSEALGGDRVTLVNGPTQRLAEQISFAIIQTDVGNDLVTAAGTRLGRGIWAFGGDDDVTGGETADLLVGEAGSDRLRGRGGNDDLRGDGSAVFTAGDDVIFAGGGDDVLYAGWGRDSVYGGSGRDLFILGGTEAATILTIGDFQSRIDQVQFNVSPDNFTGLDSNGNGRFDAGDATVAVRNGDLSVDMSSSFGVSAGTMVLVLQDYTSIAIQDNFFGFG